MKNKILFLVLSFLAMSTSCLPAKASKHPCLILTDESIESVKAELKSVGLLTTSINNIKIRIDKKLDEPIDVPMPKDAGGGYTHEQHKRNYTMMYESGVLYQIFKEDKYAKLVKNTLIKYATMYPKLPLHPVKKSSYRGKLFWQGLNESVWLVYTSQAYDCIYNYLTEDERNFIENGLFKPMVKFLAEDNKKTFTRIHNHGTWSVAAVGMISYVMGDMQMAKNAICGPEGYSKAGFLAQIDELFSPDGYFVEGPYYQRYSLQPFLTLALAIHNNEPERRIFEYKNGVLVKAVTTLLQLTDDSGDLLKLNDCLEKNWNTTELVWGVDIAYSLTKDKSLLSIAKEQGAVMISKEGAEVSRNIDNSLPFKHNSINIVDGPLGKNGGIGILRTKKDCPTTSLVMKYTSQGMGHGHYDKLSFTLYDNNNEIIKDYGAARFLNIEPKNGGHYLYENDAYAKQTIAHNTLVVDKTSHYNGKLKTGSKYSPAFYAFDGSGDNQIISAIDTNAYAGIKMHRTMFLLSLKYFEHPLIVDIMKVCSKENHTYDMPIHYNGHVISTNYPYHAYTDSRQVLDNKNGYQFYWVEALADSLSNLSTTTWLYANRFYSLSTLTNVQDKIYLNRLGANDPNFNLRHEPCIMHRTYGKNKTFISTIEIHGEYNPHLEYTLNPYTKVSEIVLEYDTEEYTQITIKTKKGDHVTICLSNKNNNENEEHQVNGYSWKGTYKVFY